jgi:IS4 transposase
VIQEGKQPGYRVTDLAKRRLSDRQVATIYGARWGVEVFFRTFKQTFGCRKLRSRSSPKAQLEIEWALMGLWSVSLLGTHELRTHGHGRAWLSPHRVS